MSVNIGALPLPTPPIAISPGRTKDTPEKIQDAASQFESMLIGQMLRTVRESDSGTDAQSNSASTYMELAEQQFAQALSARGGMGMAKMVVAQLGRS